MANEALIAEYNQLAQASAAAYKDAQSIIAQGTGPNATYGEVSDLTGRTVVKGSGSIYAEFGLTPPGRLPSQALRDRLSQDLATLTVNRTRMGTIYSELHPTFELSPAEFIGILVATVATAGAASYLAGAGAAAGAAGASGAAAGGAGAAAGGGAAAAGGLAAAAAPTFTTIGTGAALTTTAGTLAQASTALAGAGLTTAAASAAATASTAGTLASELGKGVSALTGSSTAGGLVSDIVGNASSLFQDIENFVKPLTDFASQILNGIKELNTNIIQPLADTVSSDFTTVTGLVKEVHELAGSGLKGILAIPDALASAFTSLDAANQRLAQLTGVINTKIASDVLVPGIGDKVASPLGDIHAVMNSAWNTPVPDVGNLQPIQLDESLFKYDDLITKFNTVTTKLANTGFVGKALAVLVEGFNDILGFLASTENLVKIAKQKGDQLLPVEPLGVEEVIDAWWKDHFDEATAMLELSRHGIDATRAKALYILKEWLPDPTTALTMFYKGVITWDEVNNALKRQGFSAADIEGLSKSILEAINPREAIGFAGRLAAASEGFLSGSLSSKPSDELAQLYPQRLQRADIANWDWLAHWNIQGIDWWITAWYRGVVSDNEFNLAAKALNIPDELVPHLTKVGGQTIQLWMIPQMLALNVFSEQQARDYLKYIGIEPNSIDLLIQYGNVQANKGKGPDPLGLGKISEGMAKKMLEDGIIDRNEFEEILIAHGYTNQAAVLTANLAQLEIDLTSRKAFANSLLQEYEQGLIDLATLQSQLYQENFTENEVANYVRQAEANAVKHTKRLSNTDIKDFFKAGLFTEAQALNELEAIGWSQANAQNFLTLWQGTAQAPPAQGGPTQPNSGGG